MEKEYYTYKYYKPFTVALSQLYCGMKGMGFEINPCDKCTANKIIDGHQCTICWYVGDNKLSHKDPKVVTMILDKIKKHFGELVINT
jgi:hypothetical protein